MYIHKLIEKTGYNIWKNQQNFHCCFPKCGQNPGSISNAQCENGIGTG
jgi:hypothetical protein